MQNYFSLGFGIFTMIIFAITGIVGTGFQKLAMYFPVTVSALGFLLSGIYVVLHIRSIIKKTTVAEEATMEEQKKDIYSSFYYMGWFIGYIVLIYVAGIYISSAIFLGTFLFFEAKMRWWGILITVVSCMVLLFTIGRVMHLYWPQSLLGI